MVSETGETEETEVVSTGRTEVSETGATEVTTGTVVEWERAGQLVTEAAQEVIVSTSVM